MAAPVPGHVCRPAAGRRARPHPASAQALRKFNECLLEDSQAIQAKTGHRLAAGASAPPRPPAMPDRRRHATGDSLSQGPLVAAPGVEKIMFHGTAAVRYRRRPSAGPLTRRWLSGVMATVAHAPQTRQVGDIGVPDPQLPAPRGAPYPSQRRLPGHRPAAVNEESVTPRCTRSSGLAERNDRPCASTCTASSRLLLPLPLAPRIRFRPSSSPISTCCRLRSRSTCR